MIVPRLLGCGLLLLRLAASAHAQIVLEAPTGGWKHSGEESVQHMQEVHYPANRVNAGGQHMDEAGRDRGAAIRGRIANHPKASRAPYLLVVNGLPMPLSVGPDGQFARPYAFPPQANSIEIRSPDRRMARRVNFYDANPNRQRVDLRIVLSWDSDMTDLDLHVISPDGQHVFYGKRAVANGGALDVDVTGGYGPEIYAIPAPPRGNWQIYVNYFGGGWSDGLGDADDAKADKPLTVAQVAIISHEGTLDEKREVFRVPMRRPGDLTLVKSFVYP